MNKGWYMREQMRLYSLCFATVKNYLLEHRSLDLIEFEKYFNDRSLTLFPDYGLDDFILGFFSSSNYCQLDRGMKTILHSDIKYVCTYDLKNKK